LRQSTQVDVRIGPFVDVGDGFTPETGITLSGADEAEALRAGTATLDISGATWAPVTGADGWYTLTLSTTATNTVGELVIVVQDDSVCLPVYQTFYVVEEAIFDALFAASATGLLPANVTQFGGSNGTFASGRPEVNMSHIAGSAVSTSTAQLGVNVVNFGGSAGTFASGRPAVNTTYIAGSAVSTSTAQIGVNVVNFGGSAGTFSSGRPEVNTTLIEGSDATNQIRDSIVDDATRIDASALNTLSSHDPGEAIMGATDLGTGSGLTSLASAANLATVAGYVDTEIAAIITTLGTPAGASVSADIAAVKSDSAAILTDTGTDGVVVASGSKSGYSLASNQSGVTIGTVNALGTQAKADVNAEADTALADYDAPTKAELDSAVSSLATASALSTTDGKVDGIKAKTDQLAFGAANTVNANITYVNEVAVNGAGTEASPWGP